MLPDFRQHLRGHLGWQWLGVSIVAALMTFALLRNSTSDVLALLGGAAAIVLGISFSVLRDQPGYWIYATLAPKFMIDQRMLDEMKTLRFTPWVRWITPLQRPFAAPILLAVILVVMLSVGFLGFPDHHAVVLGVLLILVYPILLYLHMTGSVLYFAMLAGPEGEQAVLGSGMRRRNLACYRLEDLAISLLITYALIWPLHAQPAFGLDGGYADPDFIAAALVLCAVAAFFMQLSARRSRVYSLVGECLSAMFKGALVALPASFSRVSSAVRAVAYAIVLAVWVVLLCLVLSTLLPNLPFPLFCVLLLPPLGWIYWVERGLTLSADMQKALQFIEEQSVPTASAERHGMDGR